MFIQIIFISQHDLCFMHNRTIKNGLVYRLTIFSFIFPRKTFLVEVDLFVDWWKPERFLLLDSSTMTNTPAQPQGFSCLHSFLINHFFSTFFLLINKIVSRAQQLALTDWRNEQEDTVFIGLQNKLRKKIYAEFCKLSEAENRLGCREEIMCQSKPSIQT